MIPDFSKYPICDTDIWVNLCLGDAASYILQKHKMLIFADVVEKEINLFNSNKEFSYIAQNFKDYKQNGDIFVIDHGLHIPPSERAFMEKTLMELEFSHGLKNKPPEKNKGEIVSAIYADHFSIPFLTSNDGTFKNGQMGNKNFPLLLVKDWYCISEEYIKDFSQRIAIRKIVESKRKLLKKSNYEYKNGSAKQETLNKLQLLLNANRLH